MLDNSINIGFLDHKKLTLHTITLIVLLVIGTDFNLDLSHYFLFVFCFILAYFTHELAHFTALTWVKNTVFKNSADKLSLLFHQDLDAKGNRISLLFLPLGAWWSTPLNCLKSEILSGDQAVESKLLTDSELFRMRLLFYLAGPLANLLIATYLYFAVYSVGYLDFESGVNISNLKVQLLFTQLAFGLYNLLPCAPSDLGLFLYNQYPNLRVSLAKLTQMILILIGLFSIWINSLSLLCIVAFGFIHTVRISVYEELKERGASLPVGQFLRKSKSLTLIHKNCTVSETVSKLLSTTEDILIVVKSSEPLQTGGNAVPVGIIERSSALTALAQGNGSVPISDPNLNIIRTDVRVSSPTSNLGSLFRDLYPFEEQVCIVLDNSDDQSNAILLGIVSPTRIANILWVQQIDDLNQSLD